MATVTSYSSLSRPSKSELRQFADLFMPLFAASSHEAKKDAIAALSQHPNIPPAVAFFIAAQPISLAAPFLISSQCLDDETLINIARTQGSAHAKAIVRREDLSPTVIDALVGLQHIRSSEAKHLEKATKVAPAKRAQAQSESSAHNLTRYSPQRIDREEKLREQLREMVHQHKRVPSNRIGMLTLDDVQEALLVRFARERNARLFSNTLADALSSSHYLSERILLDITGHQLGTTLIGCGMNVSDCKFILENFYPHLRQMNGSVTRADLMLEMIDPIEAEQRVDSWRRTDRYSVEPGHESGAPANELAEPRKLIVRR